MANMTEKEWLSGIKKGLSEILDSNKKALPDGFNKDRFMLNCITVIQDMLRDNKKKGELQKIDPTTIPICLAKGAYLGLDFFNGECYCIPYSGEAKFQTDYKGEIKLCKRYSKNPIKDIFAKVVREGDFFLEEVDGGVQNVTYRPVPFSDAEMVGAFAIVVYKDGSMLYDTMSKVDIENVRKNYSKAQDSKAWRVSPGEMYKKTVLRRLCKLIDLDFDTVEARLAYLDGGVAEFETGSSLLGDNQAALPDKGTPVDVFATAQQPQKEPEPVKQTTNREEFQQFEQQMYGQPPVDPDFNIPDEELPFR